MSSLRFSGQLMGAQQEMQCFTGRGELFCHGKCSLGFFWELIERFVLWVSTFGVTNILSKLQNSLSNGLAQLLCLLSV